MSRTTSAMSLYPQAKKIASEHNQIVVKSHSQRQTDRFAKKLTGMVWYGPLALGSKTKLYLADDTPENRKIVEASK